MKHEFDQDVQEKLEIAYFLIANLFSFIQELRKDGFDLAESRYRELKPLLDEVCLNLSLYLNILE